tara:strand:- start:434 stop:748 length:315 start_codon:yes stop_codon:yes gene_type:complete
MKKKEALKLILDKIKDASIALKVFKIIQGDGSGFWIKIEKKKGLYIYTDANRKSPEIMDDGEFIELTKEILESVYDDDYTDNGIHIMDEEEGITAELFYLLNIN